jgi:hypothetical protein
MKKPTIRQQISQLKKQKAAFDAGMLELKQRPQRIIEQLSKPTRDLEARQRKFEAYQRKMKQQLEALGIEAVKRQAAAEKEARARMAEARAQIERPMKEQISFRGS